MNSSGCFQTNDVNLVAYLAVRGIPHTAMVLDGPEVQWAFDRTEALSNELTAYNTGSASVDPAEYGRQVARTRRGLFQFKAEQQANAA